MRQFRIRFMTATLAAVVAISAGCKDSTPPPAVPHKEGTDGGVARPHGEAPPKGGKKSPPRLDD